VPYRKNGIEENQEMRKYMCVGVFIAIAVVLLCGRLYGAADVTSDDIAMLKRTGKAFSEVAKISIPAVVFIKVEKTMEARMPNLGGQLNDPFDFFGDGFFERFFRGRGYESMPHKFKQKGQGSGFIISKDGYILTNNHVVGDADKITVKLNDGREFEAKRIGSDPKSEVAVIKIDGPEDLPFLEAGNSSDLEIGEWVIAVGNPFGLAETLTVGVVSAKGRSNIGIAEYEDFIQTDAAINPGNSGGPLLNIEGKVIGINTAIYSRSGGYMGIGFAIPIDYAEIIKDQLVSKGKVVRGFLGIQLNREDINEDLAESFGLEKAGGVLIAEVIEDSSAQKAGLKPGDIILEINGDDVKNNRSFRNTVAMIEPGIKVTLTIFRDNMAKKVPVTIGTFPDDEFLASNVSGISERLGLTVQNLTPELARRFKYELDGGVIVAAVEPGSAAHSAGIQPGFLIDNVNHIAVRSVTEFNEALSRSAKTRRVLLRVKSKRGSSFVLLRLD